MKVELDDNDIHIFFEDKSEHQQRNHVLSFFGDNSEIIIYLSDEELQKLKEILQ